MKWTSFPPDEVMLVVVAHIVIHTIAVGAISGFLGVRLIQEKRAIDIIHHCGGVCLLAVLLQLAKFIYIYHEHHLLQNMHGSWHRIIYTFVRIAIASSTLSTSLLMRNAFMRMVGTYKQRRWRSRAPVIALYAPIVIFLIIVTTEVIIFDHHTLWTSNAMTAVAVMLGGLGMTSAQRTVSAYARAGTINTRARAYISRMRSRLNIRGMLLILMLVISVVCSLVRIFDIGNESFACYVIVTIGEVDTPALAVCLYTALFDTRDGESAHTAASYIVLIELRELQGQMQTSHSTPSSVQDERMRRLKATMQHKYDGRQDIIDSLSNSIIQAKDLALWWRGPPMTCRNFFSFPNPVNTAESRTHALLTCVIVPIVIYLDNEGYPPVLGLYVMYGFMARALAGPRLDLQAYLVLFVLAPLITDNGQRSLAGRWYIPVFTNDLAAGPPRRFAQLCGAMLSLSAIMVRMGYPDMPHISYWIWCALAIISSLACVHRLCLGCFVWYVINKCIYGRHISRALSDVSTTRTSTTTNAVIGTRTRVLTLMPRSARNSNTLVVNKTFTTRTSVVINEIPEISMACTDE